jgi:hypothetical protein
MAKVKKETGMPAYPLLFNILLEFLTRATRQVQKIKMIHIGKEEVKLFLFADDLILYLNTLNIEPKTLRNQKYF